MDSDRRDIVIGQPRTKGSQFSRRILAPFPGGRVIDEDLQRAGTDRVRPVDRLDHAAAERQVGTESSTIGKHHGILRRGAGAAACRIPRRRSPPTRPSARQPA